MGKIKIENIRSRGFLGEERICLSSFHSLATKPSETVECEMIIEMLNDRSYGSARRSAAERREVEKIGKKQRKRWNDSGTTSPVASKER